MADAPELAQELWRLEILLQALLLADRRGGAPMRARRNGGNGRNGRSAAPRSEVMIRLTTGQQHVLFQRLLPALTRAIALLRSLDRPEPLSDDALRRRFHLTKREVDVLRLLVRGWSNGEIARALGISVHTVRHHTERVFVKLNVHARGQLGPAIGVAPL